MIELICRVFTYIMVATLVILIAGIPVVMGIAALAALWRWFGI